MLKIELDDRDLICLSFFIFPGIGLGVMANMHIESPDWFATPTALFLIGLTCFAIGLTAICYLFKRLYDVKKEKQRMADLCEVKDLTSEIVIGTQYVHNNKRYKLVTITNKTRTSVQFVDQKGYFSWFGAEEFGKFMTKK